MSKRCIVWMMAGLLFCAPLFADPWPENRPFTQYTEPNDWAVRQIKALDDAGIHKLFAETDRGYSKRARTLEAGVEGAVAQWIQTKDAQYRDLAVRALKAAIPDYLGLSDEALRAKINEKGSLDMGNIYARDACHYFALLHYLTGEQSYARKCAVMLARFGEAMPKWKLHNPYHKEPRKAFDPDDPDAYKDEYCAGPWGIWLHSDCYLGGVPLARAYDLIYGSGEMQKLGAVQSIEAMLRKQVEMQFRFVKLSNMDGSQLQGVLEFAKLLREPEWVHRSVWWIRALYQTQFYADGWWHEGAPSYHAQLHWRLRNMALESLKGYSDPPGFVSGFDGTRYDNLAVAQAIGGAIDRADGALRKVIQPNGLFQVIHDTAYPARAWGVFPKMSKAEPVLFGCMGHAILGMGEGDGMAQASLHFSGVHGHSHYDSLNFTLFAKGHELISETNYHPPEGSDSTREWHTMTAGHVTVLVDEQDQRRYVVRKKRPDDDVPGIPDWQWRWRGHGSSNNDGKLRLFSTDFDKVQVVEADGDRMVNFPGDEGGYRRTIALVEIVKGEYYVVDIFRVKGGKIHDYMLHGCLEEPHSLSLSVPLSDWGGKEPLHKYIRNVRAGRPDGAWTATFTLDNGKAHVTTFMLPQPNTTVLQGDAPAMRRVGHAPFIAVRHTGGESVFVAVHHPHTGDPLVKKVEAVDLQPADGGAVALRVTLPDRTDTIVSTGDAMAEPVYSTAGGALRLRARFAHVAQGVGADNWLYRVGGDLLAVGNRMVQGAVAHRGVITGTRRLEAGQECNAFLTATPLPVGGSMNGRTLMVDEAGLLVQSFVIKRVERRGDVTFILTDDEPGMTVNGDLIKLVYFPCWGIRGEARFTIAGSALLRRTEDGGWRASSCGDVTARIGKDRIE